MVENEISMLKMRGHNVSTFFIHSNNIKNYKFIDKVLMLPRIIYNEKILKQVKKIILKKRIDIVHVHNFWPLISPSIFFLFNKLKIPYLQTVHNYRYITANAMLYSWDVKQPENKLNIKRRKFNSFRESYLLTSLYGLTARFVRYSGIINEEYGALQVLNRFSYDVHRQVFDRNRLFIRGNFLPDEIAHAIPKFKKENFYLFLGRLSKEKGIETLIRAFRKLNSSAVLIIAGNGPLEKKLRMQYDEDPSIQFVGFVNGQAKYSLIGKAKALIIPSEWQEVFPVSLLEANFSSTPVIAARIGGLSDMVQDRQSGLLFESGDITDLKEKLKWCEDNPKKVEKMGASARKFADDHFSEKKSYDRLMNIYAKLISRSKKPNNTLKRNDR